MTVREIVTDTDFEEIEPAWRALRDRLPRRNIEHHPRWVRVQARENGCDARAIALFDGARLSGVAPLLIRPWTWRARLGLRKVASFPVSLGDLAGDGLLTSDDEAGERRLLEAIADSKLGFDMLYLESIPERSPLARIVREAQGVRSRFWLHAPAEPTTHWRIRVEGSFGDYLDRLDQRTRQNLLRKARKLERDCKAGLRLERVTSRDRVGWFLEHAARLSAASWQGKTLDLVIEANERAREAYERRAELGWLRSYLLCDGDRPIAFEIGLQEGGIFSFERTGYDPAYAVGSPGRVMLTKILEDLFVHDRPAWADFGSGDAPYKRELCTDSHRESTFYLLRKTPYMAMALATHEAVAQLDRSLRRTVDRLELRDTLRRVLRGHANARVA